MFGSKFPVFPILLSLLVVSLVHSAHDDYNKKHRGKDYDRYDHKDVQITSSCEAGDYYIVSHVLGFYVAYATKYKDLVITWNCPVAVLASHTYVNIEGDYTYFWNKDCGTIQTIISNVAVEMLCAVFDRINAEDVFNEIVGIKGHSLSQTSVWWAEQVQTTLLYVLDQTHHLKYLVNFNGALLYPNIFPQKGIHINSDKTPLSELVFITNVVDFMAAIEYKSSMVRALRALSQDDKFGSNQLDHNIHNPHVCYKYIFGCLSSIETLAHEIECLYDLAKFSKHGVDFEHLSEVSLTVEGLASCVNNLHDLWVDQPPNQIWLYGYGYNY
ncbi:hypothetical protein DMENIID0001_030640 [Sergentomyia squamirostris]